MHFFNSSTVSATDESRSATGDPFAEHPTATVRPTTPTPLQVALAENRTAVVTATVSSHFAYWHYLVRYRRMDFAATANRRYLATAGLAWGVVYLGVLSTITIAQRDIARHTDRLIRPSDVKA
ncbi:hypothetical protein B0T10DRAFT_563685 [Thelonectria olida]|uniref:Uncharacterized protein n=1 Tax=Thelonectria olida TaxID=1576542 RepID=A0A9P8W1K1_9HYPO|nr:hypothetical protein B0T10DRAFT_563685 [Thelonectria olida]